MIAVASTLIAGASAGVAIIALYPTNQQGVNAALETKKSEVCSGVVVVLGLRRFGVS